MPSLQDMCMIHITMCLEEFTVEALSQLPLAIRRRLLNGLTKIDVLNLEGSPISNGLDICADNVRGKVLNVLLNQNDSFFPFRSIFAINLNQLLDLAADDKKNYRFEYVARRYPSCLLLRIPGPRDVKSIFPHRVFRYISFEEDSGFSVSRSDIDDFLLEHYKAEAVHASCVRLNCISFSKTFFWIGYVFYYKRRWGCRPRVDAACGMTPLQVALSKIEKLQLSCCGVCRFGVQDEKEYVSDEKEEAVEETIRAVSSFILHNIATSKQPCLKHLMIYGDHSTSIVSGLGKFLCDDFYSQRLPFSGSEFELRDNPLFGRMPLPCDSEDTALCMLEGISACTVSDIDDEIEQIIRFQMSHLKSMKLNFSILMEYQPNRFCDLLLSFLQQPQFQSLDIASVPLPVAYKLVVMFLTTPATIEQNLKIRIYEYLDEDLYYQDDRKHGFLREIDHVRYYFYDNYCEEGCCNLTLQDPIPPICQPIHESSTRFKRLDVHGSSDRFHAWLLNLSELKLKRLKICADYIHLLSPKMAIQIEHLTLWITPSLTRKIVLSDLEISNLALKTLEITVPPLPRRRNYISTYEERREYMCEQRRKLGCLHKHIDPKEFFSFVRELSHKHGTTLVLFPYHVKCFSEEHLRSVLPELSKEFQTKKIKKIICKIKKRETDFLEANSCLNLIAEKVEFIQ